MSGIAPTTVASALMIAAPVGVVSSNSTSTPTVGICSKRFTTAGGGGRARARRPAPRYAAVVPSPSSDADRCWEQVERPELDGAINGLWKEEAYGEVVQLKNLPFVIRYEAEGDHSGLMWHKDNADVSFIVLLSEPEL